MAWVRTRFTVAAGVVVNADPQRVWDVAVDWPRQHEWIWATRVDGGHGPGAHVTGVTGIGPVRFTDTMIITEWDPPRRCVVEHTGRVVRGSGVLEVIPREAGDTEFRWVEHLVIPLSPPTGRLVSAVIGQAARLGLGWSLRKFARLLEADRCA